MKDLLKYYVSSLSHATLTLKKKSILVEKPWALVDNNGAIQKLIFRRDKRLVLSKNGVVTEGSWDYYSEARSLFIDRGADKLLLNEQYIDENALILKKDGTDNEFFAFANENTLPNYNIVQYLNSLHAIHCYSRDLKLADGAIFRILRSSHYILSNIPANICEVKLVDKSCNTYDLDDGVYITESQEIKLRVKNKKLVNLRFVKNHELVNGWKITINQKYPYCISKNDEVADGKPFFPIPDGRYRIKGRWQWVRIKNCVIV